MLLSMIIHRNQPIIMETNTTCCTPQTCSCKNEAETGCSCDCNCCDQPENECSCNCDCDCCGESCC